jgi:MoaA/NifB/PqqE/SkfB family radical SAM enzyme
MVEMPASPMVSGLRFWRHRLGMLGSVFAIARAHAPSTLRAFSGAVELLRGADARFGDRPTPRLARAGGRTFLAPQLPGWPSPAWDRFIAGELGRYVGFGPRRTLQSVLVAITRACPLRCAHCSEAETVGNGPDVLTLDDLRRLTAALVERGVSLIQLTGGEPLSRPEAIEAMAAVAVPRADVWVLTSGFGLDAAMAVRLSAAGITGVQVSLDHHEAAGHDALRRHAGAFERALAAVGHARAAGLAVCLNLVARPGFAARADLEPYALLARRKGAQFIQLLEPRATGAWAGATLALTPAELAGLEAWSLEMNHRRDQMPLVAYHGFAQRRVGCWGAGDRYAFVDPLGRLHACPFCRGPAGSALDDLDGALARLAERGCQAFHGATPGLVRLPAAG